VRNINSDIKNNDSMCSIFESNHAIGRIKATGEQNEEDKTTPNKL
jgi:hypothetical protein